LASVGVEPQSFGFQLRSLGWQVCATASSYWLRWCFVNCVLGLLWNLGPSDLSLPSSWNLQAWAAGVCLPRPALVFFFFIKTSSCCIDPAAVELIILLPQPCWVNRHVPPHLVDNLLLSRPGFKYFFHPGV
jgi:hypothetical protein